MATILAIDDDPSMLRVMTAMLAAAGHSVHGASDGHKGLALFSLVDPELVITDIVMPNQEGIETIRELRSKASGIPILAISAGRSYLPSAITLGASAALSKPFSRDELLTTVADLLSRRLADLSAVQMGNSSESMRGTTVRRRRL